MRNGSLVTAALLLVVVFLVPTRRGIGAERPPQSYGMKIALAPNAISQARRITTRSRDLPGYNSSKEWIAYPKWQPGYVNRVGPSLIHCQGRYADLSSFTFRGGWSTRLDRLVAKSSAPDASTVWELTSGALVLATPAQAKRYFDVVTTWQTRCLKTGMTVGNVYYTSVLRAQVPAVADQQVEFRARQLLISNPAKPLGTIAVFLRRGAVNMQLTFEWSHTPVPDSLINAVAKKMAARAG